MTIIEAIKARDKGNPYIKREAWRYPENWRPSVLPIDGADRFVVESKPGNFADLESWRPALSDVLATDWTTAGN